MMQRTEQADAVVVGGGTVGAWAAWFLRRSGLERVVLVERGVLGGGASSRAAGMVRGQGGTETAVRLGMWTKDFYLRQLAEMGIDSGFTPQGYFMPAFDDAEVAAAHARMEMQRHVGLDVSWLDADEAAARNPTLAPGSHLGGTWAASDGWLDPPRNVLAYAVALAGAGVDVRERTAFTGLRTTSSRPTPSTSIPAAGPTPSTSIPAAGPSTSTGGCVHAVGPSTSTGGCVHAVGPTPSTSHQPRRAVTGPSTSTGGCVHAVETTGGVITTSRVLLTGGPSLAAVGALAGITIPAGGTRHQVAVTAPHPDLAPARLPMVFDVAEGLYWRPEEGGLLFGMSNPDEPPGEATEIDWPYLERIRHRLAELVPITAHLGLRRVWAATIDYTPDHLPIIGPAIGAGGAIGGVTIASAGGHGMMWGPAVARAAADLVLTGTTGVVDATILGLDRFDEHGHSRLTPDPIALPFPERTTV